MNTLHVCLNFDNDKLLKLLSLWYREHVSGH